METFETALAYASDAKVEIFLVLLTLCMFKKGINSLYNRPNIPGPFPWPLIGNAASLGSQPQYSMQAMARKYGPVYLMKLGSADVLVLNDYESIKEALGRQRNIFVGRPQFDSFTKISQGKGIVFNSPLTQGEDWHKRKMIVVRNLHKFIVSKDTRAQLADHIRKEGIHLVHSLNELCEKSPGGVVEPEPIINISVANIVCALMFGHRYDYNNEQFQDLISLNRQFGDVVGAGSQVDVMPWIKLNIDFNVGCMAEWREPLYDAQKGAFSTLTLKARSCVFGKTLNDIPERGHEACLPLQIFNHRVQAWIPKQQNLFRSVSSYLVNLKANNIHVRKMKIFPTFQRALKTFNFLTDRLNNWMLLRTSEHRSKYVHGVTRDLVDTFISEGINDPNSPLKDDIIMALTSDVFGAAQDTLSTTVQWVFIYMMYFPEIQEKIHDELDFVLGDESLPEVFNKKLFPYTEAVMHEVFRHSTFTSTTIPHTTTRDTMLGGYHIPKNILVFINQFAANHDPRHWSDPDEFRPERFLNKNGEVIPNAHDKYLLFSFGSRKCPGDELSRLLLLHFIVVVFSLCKVESDPKKPVTLEAVYNLSMRPKELKTKLRVRKPRFLNELVCSLSRISPQIPTVDAYSSSFDSSISHLDVNRNELYNQAPVEHLEFSDGDDDDLRANKWSFNRSNKDYRKISTFRNNKIPKT